MLMLKEIHSRFVRLREAYSRVVTSTQIRLTQDVFERIIAPTIEASLEAAACCLKVNTPEHLHGVVFLWGVVGNEESRSLARRP